MKVCITHSIQIKWRFPLECTKDVIIDVADDWTIKLIQEEYLRRINAPPELAVKVVFLLLCQN